MDFVLKSVDLELKAEAFGSESMDLALKSEAFDSKSMDFGFKSKDFVLKSEDAGLESTAFDLKSGGFGLRSADSGLPFLDSEAKTENFRSHFGIFPRTSVELQVGPRTRRYDLNESFVHSPTVR